MDSVSSRLSRCAHSVFQVTDSGPNEACSICRSSLGIGATLLPSPMPSRKKSRRQRLEEEYAKTNVVEETAQIPEGFAPEVEVVEREEDFEPAEVQEI